MAEALAILTTDPAKRSSMGRSAAERAQAQFGIERMFRDYEQMYLSLGTPA
jgi:hypothetical protein